MTDPVLGEYSPAVEVPVTVRLTQQVRGGITTTVTATGRAAA